MNYITEPKNLHLQHTLYTTLTHVSPFYFPLDSKYTSGEIKFINNLHHCPQC